MNISPSLAGVTAGRYLWPFGVATPAPGASAIRCRGIIRLWLAACLLTGGVAATTRPAAAFAVMPAPASLRSDPGRLPLTAAATFAITGVDDARLRGGLARMLRRAEERTGLTFARQPTGEYAVAGTTTATFLIECAAAGAPVPALGEDESYTLAVTLRQVVLRAPTVLGALHGFETLLQLLEADASGWYLPAVAIKDQPRFPWRGLLIDVARHWQPMAVIRRNLDGMALVKLNVLHLHLTDDQGFRLESRKFPAPA